MEKHITNSYLKSGQAPMGVKPVFESVDGVELKEKTFEVACAKTAKIYGITPASESGAFSLMQSAS